MHAQLCNAKVLKNTLVVDNIMLMDCALPQEVNAPKAGQFYMLRCWAQDEAPLLSRPISVHEYDAQNHVVTFLYDVKGIGTEKLQALKEGEFISLTGAAGNGFDVEKISGKVAVVGGGIGTAPLLQLAKELKAKGASVHFYGGWRETPYCVDSFEKVCESVNIATDLGTVGTKGFVTDIIPYADFDFVCICGPEIMMEKTAKKCMDAGVTAYVSKEAKMACGIGACLGCTCKTKNGGKSVCKDGPVFLASEVYDIG